MGLFYSKDEFGFKSLRKKAITAYTLIIICILSVTLMECSCESHNTSTEVPQLLEFEEPEVVEPPVILTPVKVKKVAVKEMKVVKIYDKLCYVKTIELKVTCYSPISDKGYKGIYANDDLSLPRVDRRAGRYDHTVALNKKMREYHISLFKKQDGVNTHKYRFHVPGYNHEEISQNPDGEYFSQPKDCMTHNNKKTKLGECLYCSQDRIDVFLSTAGKYKSLEQRQEYWQSTYRLVEIWEWRKFVKYSDGSKERVE